MIKNFIPLSTVNWLQKMLKKAAAFKKIKNEKK